jgi:putative RecB family exonuclease
MTVAKNPAFDLRRRPVPDLHHMSASSVITYLTCGLQWRLGHVDGLKPKKLNPAYAVGTAMHEGLQPFWQGGDTNFPFAWKKMKHAPIDYSNSRLSWLDWLSRGQKMTARVQQTLHGLFDEEASQVEFPYDVYLKDVLVVRKMDIRTIAKSMPILIDNKLETFSGPIVLDLKTSSQSYQHDAADLSQQLGIYSIPGRIKDDLKPQMAAFVVVTKSDDPKVQIIGKRYEKDELKAQIRTVRQVADQVRAGVFIQNKGKHCRWCDFRKLCFPKANGGTEVPWQELYSVPGDRPGSDATNTGGDPARNEGSPRGSGSKVKVKA